MSIKVSHLANTLADEIFDDGRQIITHPRNQDTDERSKDGAVENDNRIGGNRGGGKDTHQENREKWPGNAGRRDTPFDGAKIVSKNKEKGNGETKGKKRYGYISNLFKDLFRHSISSL